MSKELDYKELFGIYAAEVGSYLPRHKRKDIQMEILSLLEDALEDKMEEAAKLPDEDMVLDVLEEFGPPITFASNYRTDQTLVGPDIFPLFRPVLTLVAVIYLAQFLVGVLIAVMGSNFDLLETIDAFFDNGFMWFGILVFSFAMLERTTPKTWLRWPFKELKRTWDPADLKRGEQQKFVKPFQYLVEALFMAGFAVLFIFFPQWIGFGNNTNGVWSFVPVLSLEFGGYLPWIGAYFLSRFAFNLMLAQQGYWDTKTRWVDIGTRLFGLALLAALFMGPEILGINEAYLAMHTHAPDQLVWFEKALPTLNGGFGVYLILAILVQIAILIKKVFGVLLNRQAVKLQLK